MTSPSCSEQNLNNLYKKVNALEVAHASIITEVKGIKESLERLEIMLKEIIGRIEVNYVTKDQLALFTQDQKYGKWIAGLVGAVVTFIILGMIGIFLPGITS